MRDRYKNYCDDCEISGTCNDCQKVDFCDGCRDYGKCGIMDYCDEGHAIQCNNGYEEK